MTTAACPSPARQVPCEKCPLRAEPSLRDFSQEELDFVAGFKSGELTAEAGTTLLMQGTAAAHLYTVLSGWAMRHKTLQKLMASKATRWKNRTFESARPRGAHGDRGLSDERRAAAPVYLMGNDNCMLVSRFRSSPELAACSDANFGIGTLATL